MSTTNHRGLAVTPCASTVPPEIHEVRLSKDGHTYVFRYPAGREDQVVDEIMRSAEDATCGLDWLDAARLSYQVTVHAVGE